MPVRKYYCDYCDKQFQDTPADRKRHERGIQHQQAKARWYDSFKIEQHHLHSNATSSQGVPKPLCNHFVNTGFCRFGESCKYYHPNANNVPLPQSTMTSAPNNILQASMICASSCMIQLTTPNNIVQPSMSASNNIFQPSMLSASNNMQQSSMISTPTATGTVGQDIMGMSWDNLPPSLQPPPEGGYPSLPFVDWG